MAMLLVALLPLPASPWVAGYRIGIDGYDLQSVPDNEYWAASITIDVFPSMLASPAVFAGMLLPPIPYSDPAYVAVGVDTPLFVWHDHPLGSLFRRESAWVPRVGVSFLFNFNEPYWTGTSFTVQPLSFHFGDKQVGILGIHLVRDQGFSNWGWGIRLFEISHYLW
jgi:hypothetical protein